MTVTRYHTILVDLHWLLAIMIGQKLSFGYFVIGRLPNNLPEKLHALAVHMGIGTAIIALMVFRQITRFFTNHREPTACSIW